jgi:hypothetical protein
MTASPRPNCKIPYSASLSSPEFALIAESHHRVTSVIHG